MGAADRVAVTLARALAAAGVALACVAQSPITGEQILRNAKLAFRAHQRPPYVVYTLARNDRHHRIPDLENSYTLKVWCRSSDRSALTRTLWKGAAYGPMENITVAFDGYVDPGPPTADVFEPRLYGPPSAAPLPSPSPAASMPPTIGTVEVNADFDYRVRRFERDGDAWHLWLIWKRDPERNRIDELWVDAASYEIRRMRVRDHLYLGYTGAALDDQFDVRFEQRDGLPLITAIHGRTDDLEYETDYAYTDVTFPRTLPGWYFDPKSYGRHRNEAPS